MHQVEQGPQHLPRGTLAGPDHNLGSRDIHPALCRHPGGGDPIEVPDGQHINIVISLIGRDQSIRRRSGPAAVDDKPVGDYLTEQPFHLGCQTLLPAAPGRCWLGPIHVLLPPPGKRWGQQRAAQLGMHVLAGNTSGKAGALTVQSGPERVAFLARSAHARIEGVKLRARDLVATECDPRRR